jgi:hypothetical protein
LFVFLFHLDHVVSLIRAPVFAGASIHSHLGYILPPLLTLASQPEGSTPAVDAARDALEKVSAAVAEDGAYILIAQARIYEWLVGELV